MGDMIWTHLKSIKECNKLYDSQMEQVDQLLNHLHIYLDECKFYKQRSSNILLSTILLDVIYK